MALAFILAPVCGAAGGGRVCATLDDDREAVTTLEELERTARRVFGGAHPVTGGIKGDLRLARSPEEWRAAARGVR